MSSFFLQFTAAASCKKDQGNGWAEKKSQSVRNWEAQVGGRENRKEE